MKTIIIGVLAILCSGICATMGFSGNLSPFGGGLGWATLGFVNLLGLIEYISNKKVSNRRNDEGK